MRENPLSKLLALTSKNNEIDKKRGEEKFLRLDFALDEIAKEIEEVRAEIKENNIPHLEDELGDILWGWLMLVSKLEDAGYVASVDAIIERCERKYTERVGVLKGDKSDRESWKRIKERQKEALVIESRNIL
ncbi:MAG TPA: hypothetical protein ENL00_01645 [Nitratifractor sp.]|nr:hypothetical protein [Nitratifractor sp.]